MDDIDELLKILRELHEQKIPFNKFIGLKLEFVDLDIVRARFDARAEFIGNPVHGILHGGVIVFHRPLRLRRRERKGYFSYFFSVSPAKAKRDVNKAEKKINPSPPGTVVVMKILIMIGKLAAKRFKPYEAKLLMVFICRRPTNFL